MLRAVSIDFSQNGRCDIRTLIVLVTTRAVLKPASFAASRTDPTGDPSGSTEMNPLFDLCPAANAVPEAAESVTRLFAAHVFTRPAAS